MANIKLDKTHKPLIKAALSFGDWLLSQDALTDSDREAVKLIQQSLNKLPKVNDGTLAMYGFSIEQGDEQNGLVRGWDISLEYFADDPEQQGGLEIFSSFIPIPEVNDPEALAEKKCHEVYFHWPIGDICNLISPDKAKQWIEEITKPEQLASTGQRLRIEIVFNDYYGEIELEA